MSLFREATHRDLILFVNGIRPSTIEAIETYTSSYDKPVQVLLLVDQKKKNLVKEAKVYEKNKKVTVIYCDMGQPLKIKEVIAPYKERLLAFSSQFENSIPDLQQLLPHVPYLNGPTAASLDWSTDKIKMRRLLKVHNKSISPRFTVIKENSDAAIDQVERVVGFPVVVKPSGLAASLLVSVCYHREELEEVLKTTFKKIEKIYKEKHGRGTPQVLVEELMEGTMYSIDSYVNNRGNIYHTPPVYVVTGRSIGFDDFFGYQRVTPTKLTNNKIEDANHVAAEAIRALGLRSTTCHVELMKTDKGWKIIELAPRMGGYRHTMYNWSYGINHILNDILIRIPQKPVIPKKRKGYSAVFNIYAKKEGILDSVKGVRKVRELDSFVHMEIGMKRGDQLLFAKNGGDVVVKVILFNKDRPNLLADIRRMEKAVEITVKPKKRSSKK